MSIMFDKLRENPIMEEISMDETPFSYGRSEGAPYLFFKGDEWYDLMGHEIKYYKCGVLLSLKEKYKEHPDEDSFTFFNNSGEKVLEITNIKYYGNSSRNKPKTKINLIVRDRMLEVKVTDIEKNLTEEYFVSINDKYKIYDVFESQTEDHITL